MNLLDLTPAFKRHISQWLKNTSYTDSQLAAYLADGVEALNWRWTRTYVVTQTLPNTYVVTPDITAKDKRAVILMGSIIYKAGNVELAAVRDGDFAYDPQQGRSNPIINDITELDKMVPAGAQLAKASTAPLRGFSNGFNPESYSFLVSLGVMGVT